MLPLSAKLPLTAAELKNIYSVGLAKVSFFTKHQLTAVISQRIRSAF